MGRSPFTRIAVNNPKLFLGLIATVAVGAAVMQALEAVAPNSGAARAGVFIVMAMAAAVYVGQTHDEYADEE